MSLLDAIGAVEAVKAVTAFRKHEGWWWHHRPEVEWNYNVMETSERTCSRCLSYHNSLKNWFGDEIEEEFPYHEHYRVNVIRPEVHPNCRCRLEYVGGYLDIPFNIRQWHGGKAYGLVQKGT